MSDRPHIGAVVLAGAIEVTPAPAAIIEALLSVPAHFRHIRSVRAPLDLDADVFRYRVIGERIIPVRERRGARICRDPHRRHS